MEKEIKQFIIDNKLDFSETGSALNSACCIISGFALYKGVKDVHVLLSYITEKGEELFNELNRVFNFAENAHYEKFWATEQASKEYKFSLV